MENNNYSDVMDTLLKSGSKDGSRILLETGTNELEILEFYIDSDSMDGGTDIKNRHYFGVNVAKVREVIEKPVLSKTKSTVDPSFLGTIPLRDIILPIIDIGNWLNLDKKECNEDVIIVTEFSQAITGFLVSGVTNIHRISWTEVMPPHQYISSFGVQSITGVVNIDTHITQLLDLEHIITVLNPTESEESMKTTVKASKQYSVLIAEDSPTIGMMVKKNIEAANMKVTLTSNGAEALKFLQNLKEGQTDIDIVISDIEMPRMDGFTLTKNIKGDPNLKTLPVILYSSIITEELRHKGKAVKADRQISKPELNKVAEVAIELIEKNK